MKRAKKILTSNRMKIKMEKLVSKKLAVNGGKPVRRKPWSSGPFHFREEAAVLKKVLAGPALPLARGPDVLAFREEIRKLYHARHVVTTSSGTAAIHVALRAAGLEPGQEVITSPMTDFGTVAGIFQLNAVSVFCDVVKGGFVMDADKLERLITKRTKVIMPVHNGGYVADMRRITAIARRYGITLIEDCAQSHLARLGTKYAGTWGDFGCFSTNESKHMKTGEGGFILCKRRPDAICADLFADKCYPRFPGAPRTPAFPALNVRMSDINAALGVVQIKKLPAWVKKRHAMGVRLEKIISRFPLIPHWRPPGAWCTYWWFAFYLDNQKTNVPVKEFCAALTAEGVPSSTGAEAVIPKWEIFRKLNANPNSFPTYRPGSLRKGMFALDQWPQAEWAWANIISIPLNQYTGESELRDMNRALDKIFSRRTKWS